MSNTAVFISNHANHLISLPPIRREVIVHGRSAIERVDVRDARFQNGELRTKNQNQIEALRAHPGNRANGGGLFYELDADVEQAEEKAAKVKEELGEGEIVGDSKFKAKIVEQEGGNAKIYEGVETVQDAFDVLTSEPYSLPEEALHGGNNRPAKQPVLKYANELGVHFPNLG